jgi:hypothetical protein
MKMRLNQLILAAIAALCLLCIAGAFLGAEQAWAFFNAAPMRLFGTGLAIFLAAGAFFCLLQSRPMVFLIHLGCVFVLVSGLWDPEVSPWGLHFIFAGYILLTIGLFGYFGWKVKKQKVKSKSE